MTVGIIGLGLIGGSMAKAYHNAGHTVLGLDTHKVTQGWAELSGIINGNLDNKADIGKCDLILIAICPEAAVEWLGENSEYIRKDALVIDLCGNKRIVCEAGFALAGKFGYTFAGGHPMAGLHVSGIKNSQADLFLDQPMVVVPPRHDDIALYDRIKHALAPAGFGKITYTTAEEHDRMIAFTSQLAHVVSNAYVKSPRATAHKGMSAGSYKDLTRVARLDENMWSELFLQNKDFLLGELKVLIDNLTEYHKAISDGNRDALMALLTDGKQKRIASWTMAENNKRR